MNQEADQPSSKSLVIGMQRTVYLLPNAFSCDAFLIADFLQCPVDLASNPVSQGLLRFWLFGNIGTDMVGIVKGSQPLSHLAIGDSQLLGGISDRAVFNSGNAAREELLSAFFLRLAL